eukprot:11017605-Lingulodinium_polyedra.AAC.1
MNSEFSECFGKDSGEVTSWVQKKLMAAKVFEAKLHDARKVLVPVVAKAKKGSGSSSKQYQPVKP